MRLNLYKTVPVSYIILALGASAIKLNEKPDRFAQIDLDNNNDGYTDENIHMLGQTYGNAAIDSQAAIDSETDNEFISPYTGYSSPMTSPYSSPYVNGVQANMQSSMMNNLASS